MRRIRRLFRGRHLFAAVLTLLVATGILLVGGALVLPQGVLRDVLVNLGATALGVVLTAIVLEPLVERARQPEERIHGSFPHRQFIDGVGRASRRVNIMGAWPYVMDSPWRASFLSALSAALKRGARVRILILDPTSSAAAQRQADLDGAVDVSEVIGDTIRALEEFHSTLAGAAQRSLEVRIYSTLPPARLYCWDQRAICSFFPGGNDSGADVRHYEMNVLSGLARFVGLEFNALWSHPDTQTLRRHRGVRVRLHNSDVEYEVPYATVDAHTYVASVDLTDGILRHSVDGIPPSVSVCLDGDVREEREVVAIPDDHHSVEAVRKAFLRKYGEPDQLAEGTRGVLRIL